MTRKEMETRYREIVKKDTMLDEREQTALLEQYLYLHDAAEIGLIDEELLIRVSRVCGVIEFLNDMGRIQDDEDLWMLVNEIEAYGYKHREELLSGKKGA